MAERRRRLPRPPGRALLELRTFARPETLAEIRAAVRGAALAAGCAAPCAEDIVIAVNEACMNVIQHGYRLDPRGELIVQLSARRGTLYARVLDFCATIDEKVLVSRDLDDLRPGGLGVHFMRSCMDEVALLEPPPDVGNVLQMTKRIT